MDCSKLTNGLIGAECDLQVSAGAEDTVILVNFNDIDKEASIIADNVITKLVLKANQKAYEFKTFGKSLDEAGATLEKGTYRNVWNHNVPLKIFTKTEEAKKFVNQFGAGAKVACVLKNNFENETKYEMYGFDNGLEISESANTQAIADGVVYQLTLASPEVAKEGSLPKSVFDTSIAKTTTMLDSLIA